MDYDNEHADDAILKMANHSFNPCLFKKYLPINWLLLSR